MGSSLGKAYAGMAKSYGVLLASKAALKATNGSGHSKYTNMFQTIYCDDYNLPTLMWNSKPIFDSHTSWGDYKTRQTTLMNEGKCVQWALNSEGIDADVIDVTAGPRTTRVRLDAWDLDKALKKERRIKVATRQEGTRIYPNGNELIVEIPHNWFQVKFGDMVKNYKFYRGSKTSIPIGVDGEMRPVYGDIAKMPHMLVAGTTGSGKSVFLNTVISSLIMKNRPDELQMFLVDPKMVEFKQFEMVPNCHSIYKTNEAVDALYALEVEMDRRYGVLSSAGVRNIDEYNAQMPVKMPRLILVVDELADMMESEAKKSVERSIVRIAQKARACGIHMILATQRPVVKVISGQIKANIPCRVALKVVTKVDSMTIIDRVGAEQLLGYGDMLYMDGKDNTVVHRLQSPNLETVEIRNLVAEVVTENKDYVQRSAEASKPKVKRRSIGESIYRAVCSAFAPGLSMMLACEDKIDGLYDPLNPWEREEDFV